MERRSQTLLGKHGLPGSKIEELSFDIVCGLLPALSLPPRELQVVVRIVHACGDASVAALVEFHPGAVEAGIKALSERKPVFTDVRMVAAGIKSGLAKSFGCSVRCALDSAPAAAREGHCVTRAARAMLGLGHELDGSIVAVGNAPTALLAVLDMVDEGLARPSLIVGMPVGFVAAVESKEELARRNVPFVTVRGTRGGSAMAAAAVNALLLLARGSTKSPDLKLRKG